jgi:uncharacterized membrane protein
MTANRQDPGIRDSKLFHWGIKRSLLSGVLILGPFTITMIIILWLFGQIRALIRPLVVQMLSLVTDLPGAEAVPPILLKTLVFITTILLLLLILYFIGLIGTRMMGKRLLNVVEDLIKHVPFVGSLYSASKQVLETFGSTDRQAYKSVVLVDFPRVGCKALGFLTGFILLNNGTRYAKVIIPTAPNPTTGFLQFFPADQIEELSLSIEEAFKMILSVGLVSPKKMIDSDNARTQGDKELT